MVPTQDVVLLPAHVAALTAQISTSFPSIEYLPAGVVAVSLLAFATALVLSVRRRDAD